MKINDDKSEVLRTASTKKKKPQKTNPQIYAIIYYLFFSSGANTSLLDPPKPWCYHSLESHINVSTFLELPMISKIQLFLSVSVTEKAIVCFCVVWLSYFNSLIRRSP